MGCGGQRIEQPFLGDVHGRPKLILILYIFLLYSYYFFQTFFLSIEGITEIALNNVIFL